MTGLSLPPRWSMATSHNHFQVKPKDQLFLAIKLICTH